MILRLIRPGKKDIAGYRKSREQRCPATKIFDRELDDRMLSAWIKQLRDGRDGRTHFWLVQDDGAYVGRFSFSDELLEVLKRDIVWSIEPLHGNPRVLEQALMHMGLEKIAEAILKENAKYGKEEEGDAAELDELR